MAGDFGHSTARVQGFTFSIIQLFFSAVFRVSGRLQGNVFLDLKANHAPMSGLQSHVIYVCSAPTA